MSESVRVKVKFFEDRAECEVFNGVRVGVLVRGGVVVYSVKGVFR